MTDPGEFGHKGALRMLELREQRAQESEEFAAQLRRTRARLDAFAATIREDLTKQRKHKRRDTSLTPEQLAEKKARLRKWHRKNKRK